MPTTSTENLSLAAYACSEGARLLRITVSGANGHGRRTAVFELDSPDIEALSRRFYQGEALVNLQRYINEITRLKDRLFQALKTSETQDPDRRTHDPHRQGRAGAAERAR
jgi:hypothetical protein